MATAKSIPTADMNEIQRRMAQVRHELHEEVREAVKGAQSMTDWRSQVRNHPWLALGTAAAVGYLVVPKRRQPEAPTIVTVNPVAAGLGVDSSSPAPPSTPPRGNRLGILGSAFSLVAPIAVRAAQNYAIQYLEQWLAALPSGTGPAPDSVHERVADAGRPVPGAVPAQTRRPRPASQGDPATLVDDPSPSGPPERKATPGAVNHVYP